MENVAESSWEAEDRQEEVLSAGKTAGSIC